jgi:hypothetical protein
MGLLIKLQDGDTALKSLKFGNDKPGGGDSGQPYIKTPIDKPGTPALNSDFLLRGGISAPLNAAEDVARLTKYFFDFKNPKGLLFTAKQNLLSRVAVKAEVADKTIPKNIVGPAYGGGLINEGIYTPISTIAQAGVVAFGGHLNKQGLDPTGLISSLSIKKYGDVVYQLNKSELNIYQKGAKSNGGFQSLNSVRDTNPSSPFTRGPELKDNIKLTNRLLRLWDSKQFPITNTSDILTYSGGPGSILGFGDTNIKFATLGDGLTSDRTGVNNIQFQNNKEEFLKGRKKSYVDRFYINNINGVPTIENSLNISKFIGASGKYGLSTEKIWVDEADIYGTSLNLDKLLTPQSQKSLPTTEADPTKRILPRGASEKYNQYLFPTLQEEENVIKRQKIERLKARQDELNKQRNDPKLFVSDEDTLITTPDGITIRTNRRSDSEIQELQNKISQEWGDLNQQIAELQNDINKTPITFVNTLASFPRYRNGTRVNPSDRDEIIKDIFKDGGEKHFTAYSNRLAKSGESFVKIDSEYLSDLVNPSAYDALNKSLDQKVYYDSSDPFKRKSKSLLTDFTDLIEFNFTILDPQNPSSPGTVLDFRAYLDSFSDSYSNDWKSQTYMGRAEKFYKYDSFDRSISLGFTIVADNSNNLEEMYSQLNTLASSIAPSYTSQGYMAGVLHKLTVGNYVNKQYGILQGLTFEVTDDTPWQIEKDSQLPLYIKVTGIKFTPIHNFRPEVILEKQFKTNAGGQNYYVPKLIKDQNQRYISQKTSYDDIPLPEIKDPSTPRTQQTQVSVTGNQGIEVGIPTNSSF